MKGSSPEWISNKLVNILVQTGEERQPDLANVPMLRDLVTDPNDRKVLEVLSFPQKVGVPYLMPPGTPKDIVFALRRAFDAALADPELRAESENRMLEIGPISGEDMEHIVADVYSTPKPLIERAAEYAGIATMK
jgi:tripartite-type tricarboxylate transporter receptor subunit TctC